MKLVQSMSPSRSYLGVTFLHGVAVTLPPDFPDDQVQTLLSWGWEVAADAPVVEAVPVIDDDVEPIRRTQRSRR